MFLCAATSPHWAAKRTEDGGRERELRKLGGVVWPRISSDDADWCALLLRDAHLQLNGGWTSLAGLGSYFVSFFFLCRSIRAFVFNEVIFRFSGASIPFHRMRTWWFRPAILQIFYVVVPSQKRWVPFYLSWRWGQHSTNKRPHVSVSGKQTPDGGGERLRVGSDTACAM